MIVRRFVGFEFIHAAVSLDLSYPRSIATLPLAENRSAVGVLDVRASEHLNE